MEEQNVAEIYSNRDRLVLLKLIGTEKQVEKAFDKIFELHNETIWDDFIIDDDIEEISLFLDGCDLKEGVSFETEMEKICCMIAKNFPQMLLKGQFIEYLEDIDKEVFCNRAVESKAGISNVVFSEGVRSFWEGIC